MRRIGSSFAPILALAVCFAGAAAARKHDKKTAEPFAILGGTVFHDNGLSFPGAEVTAAPDPQPGQTAVPMQNLKAISDARGEFAFRVPTSAMRYTVRAQAKGFRAQQKFADIEGEMRTDVTLVLQPESK